MRQPSYAAGSAAGSRFGNTAQYSSQIVVADMAIIRDAALAVVVSRWIAVFNVFTNLLSMVT